MSADLLRRAAALMRERAKGTPAGPWETARTSDDQFFVHGITLEGEISAEVFVHDGNRRMEFDASKVAAEHIASWHPAVALAVADWLDQFAVYEDTGENAEDERACAVAVARAYLGEPA